MSEGVLYQVLRVQIHGEGVKVGTPYTTGAAAAQFAKDMADATGEKYRVVTITTGDRLQYIQRAYADNMASGKWKPVAWASDDRWQEEDVQNIARDHLLHASPNSPANVVYANPDPPHQWRLLSASRYLYNFYSHLLSLSTQREFQLMHEDANLDTSMYTLKFTSDPTEVELVYTSGPASCMSEDRGSYHDRVHPTRLYGMPGSELSVAYVQMDNYVAARAVVCPKLRKYSRVYAGSIDSRIFLKLLREAGYTEGSLAGAVLPFVPAKRVPDCIMMPYIDGDYYGTVEEDADGGKVVRLVTSREAERISSSGGEIVSVRNTSGISPVRSTD